MLVSIALIAVLITTLLLFLVCKSQRASSLDSIAWAASLRLYKTGGVGFGMRLVWAVGRLLASTMSKICWSFFQIITLVPGVYSVDLPAAPRQVLTPSRTLLPAV